MISSIIMMGYIGIVLEKIIACFLWVIVTSPEKHQQDRVDSQHHLILKFHTPTHIFIQLWNLKILKFIRQKFQKN